MIEQFALWFFGPTFGMGFAFFLTFTIGVMVVGAVVAAFVASFYFVEKYLLEDKP